LAAIAATSLGATRHRWQMAHAHAGEVDVNARWLGPETTIFGG
jgi:hypothetical protein